MIHKNSLTLMVPASPVVLRKSKFFFQVSLSMTDVRLTINFGHLNDDNHLKFFPLRLEITLDYRGI